MDVLQYIGNAELTTLGALLLAALVYIVSRTEPSWRYKKRDLMTRNEREFFGRLSRALPNHYIFPQVAMSAIIEPDVNSGSKKHLSSFRRIAQKRVDYVVVDKSYQIICIIELDDLTHVSKKDKKRDLATYSAGIKTFRWDSREKPSVSDITKQILLQQKVGQHESRKETF